MLHQLRVIAGSVFNLFFPALIIIKLQIAASINISIIVAAEKKPEFGSENSAGLSEIIA